jgi:hypothetical protein
MLDLMLDIFGAIVLAGQAVLFLVTGQIAAGPDTRRFRSRARTCAKESPCSTSS